MRHRKKSEKFSRSRAQRKALINSLLRAIIIRERIITTKAKAKALKGYIDKLITWGKKDKLHYRRLSYAVLKEHKLVKRLFEELAPRFKDIKGGYTRLLDIGQRKGDRAQLALLEFTRREIKERKEKAKKKEKKEKPQKEEKKHQPPAPKRTKSPRRFISEVRKIFKKERDAL